MRPLLQVGLGMLFVVIVLVGRVLYESRREFHVGQMEARAGNAEEAIRHLDRAAHWYFPGNPFVRGALMELRILGEKLENHNERLALLAYDSARGSIYAIRHLFWPYQEWLPGINKRIATLRARQHVLNHPELSPKQALVFHERALALDERPFRGWLLLTHVGFLGWIGSVIGLIWKGFDPAGRMHFKPSWPWMGGIVVCFFLWVMGLMYA